MCDKTFSRNQSLTMHRRIHAKLAQKPFMCQVCGRSFKTEGDLTTHRRIHTDERSYGCEHCGKQYKTRDGLTKHYNSLRGCVKTEPTDDAISEISVENTSG